VTVLLEYLDLTRLGQKVIEDHACPFPVPLFISLAFVKGGEEAVDW